MIAKQVKGKSFRGVLNYLHSKEHSRIIGGNMAGDTPRIMSEEFALARQLNPNLKKAVYHSSLSLPKTEHLNDDTWSAIAEQYLKGMGFAESQYVVYRHSDKDHDHVHIVASRIRITDGTTVDDSWDYVRSEKLVRQLEQRYELTPTISSKQKQQRGQTTGEMRLIERTGEASVRKELQQVIDRQTNSPLAMPELINRLKEQGIDAKISQTRTGKIKGISYQKNGIAFSGTHLGKAYTFPGLQKHRKVSYDHNLHHQQLIEASNREPAVETVENKEQTLARQIELAQRTQKERTLRIAPVLRDYINEVKKAEVETKDYRVFWRKEEHTLYLYKKDETEPRLKVEYLNQKFEPIEITSTPKNQPRLTNADVEYWQQIAIRLHQVQQQRKRQQQEQQKIKRRGRSR